MKIDIGYIMIKNKIKKSVGQQIKYDKVQRSENKCDLRVKAMGDLPEEGSAERLIAPQILTQVMSYTFTQGVDRLPLQE